MIESTVWVSIDNSFFISGKVIRLGHVARNISGRRQEGGTPHDIIGHDDANGVDYDRTVLEVEDQDGLGPVQVAAERPIEPEGDHVGVVGLEAGVVLSQLHVDALPAHQGVHHIQHRGFLQNFNFFLSFLEQLGPVL